MATSMPFLVAARPAWAAPIIGIGTQDRVGDEQPQVSTLEEQPERSVTTRKLRRTARIAPVVGR